MRRQSMMKPKIFIECALDRDIMALAEQYFDCSVGTANLTLQNKYDALQGCVGYVVPMGNITRELLQACPTLQVVSNIAVGYDNFDVQAMAEHHVIGTHTPYVLDDTVADLTVGLMLAVARQITRLDKWIRTEQWQAGVPETLFGIDVYGKKVGIIGMGRIGEKIAKRLKYGFDMSIHYYNRSRKPRIDQAYGAVYQSLNEICATCDFIIVMLPLTEQTKEIIGQVQFACMQEHAIFINTARGGVVDEQALLNALKEQRIQGAGLDVFTTEPLPADHPFTQLDQVVLTPHIGSATLATRNAMQRTAINNLKAILYQQGEAHIVPELQHIVNNER